MTGKSNSTEDLRRSCNPPQQEHPAAAVHVSDAAPSKAMSTTVFVIKEPPNFGPMTTRNCPAVGGSPRRGRYQMNTAPPWAGRLNLVLSRDSTVGPNS